MQDLPTDLLPSDVEPQTLDEMEGWCRNAGEGFPGLEDPGVVPLLSGSLSVHDAQRMQGRPSSRVFLPIGRVERLDTEIEVRDAQDLLQAGRGAVIAVVAALALGGAAQADSGPSVTGGYSYIVFEGAEPRSVAVDAQGSDPVRGRWVFERGRLSGPVTCLNVGGRGIHVRSGHGRRAGRFPVGAGQWSAGRCGRRSDHVDPGSAR